MSTGQKKPGLFGRMFGGGGRKDKPLDPDQTPDAAANEVGKAGEDANEAGGSGQTGKAGATADAAATSTDGGRDATSADIEARLSEGALASAPPQAQDPEQAPVSQKPPAAKEPQVSQVTKDAQPAESTNKSITNAPIQTLPAVQEPKSWFSRLKSGLGKTSAKLSEGITGVFTKKKLAGDTIEELEDLLIQADLGVDTALSITDALSKGRYQKGISAQDVRGVLTSEVVRVLEPVAQPLRISSENRPHVILFVGVNGTGKTTTIGKLAQQYADQGKKVLLAAGDTFRAAAVDQLKIWGERTGARVISHDVGSDASGLAYDAINEARNEDYDILLIDTAGRLQNKQNLMDELGKIVRVIGKLNPGAPHDVILVLDATTGQNALSQVEVFRQIAGVTGLVMTKLDGTARGGILVAIAAKFGLPVHAIGVGEGVGDLQPFDAVEFARAIASD